jgi:uncharacterized protein (DUF849 family)
MAFVKASLNGGRSRDEHPAVPVTPEELAADARAVVAAGAQALHLHPRDRDGRETLAAEPVAAALDAVRAAVPGVPVGVSTAHWIDGDRLTAVASWTAVPDFASVNLAEDGADELAGALRARGVGIEAGLRTPADANQFLGLPWAADVVRVLVEPEELNAAEAVATATAIDAVLDAHEHAAQRVHHGYDAATWPVIEQAFARGRGARAGLEDTTTLPDGSTAPDNAALVAAAIALAEGGGDWRTPGVP